MFLLNLLKKKNNKILFTTPSHSNNFCIVHKFYHWYKADISEVDAYKPEETLAKAEEYATKIYRTKSTKFLTNGSSSGIIAAVLTCCKKDDKLLIWERAHRCHKNAGILAHTNTIEYKLDYNKTWGIHEAISPTKLNTLLAEHRPKAIIVTSPSYEGIVSNIKEIKKICEKYKTYLIVDEAHGALYPFTDELPHTAIDTADFTIQSLHKTAGGLNSTALLHCNCNLDTSIALDLISTTSPSYPMLATIEANIKYLNSDIGKKQINLLIQNLKDLKIKYNNIEFYGDDITKILIKAKGLSGFELSTLLYDKFNIEDEKTNEKSTMLLTGLGTSTKKILKLKQALKKIDKLLDKGLY